MKQQQSQLQIMLETPIPKLILTLSVPTIISMLITNIYNLVDTAFVGRLGTSASGAVGIVFGFMSIIQAFGFMFGMGSGSLISRSLGRGDNDQASIYASVGFFSAFLSGIIITIVGFIFLDDFVFFLGSTETIAPYAKSYITYILISAPFMVTSFSLNNILRFEGKAFLGMIGLSVGAVTNIIGDPILMFGFNMGISGAGLSTALSQLLSWSILLSMFLFNRTETKISFVILRYFSPKILFDIVTTGFPSLVRQGLSSFTTVLLNTECAVYGDAAVAAMGIVNRIFFFAFSIALGIGQGFQPVAGFTYGSAHYERLKKAFWFTIFAAEAVMIVECIYIYFDATHLIQVFRDDPKVIEIGVRALKLQTIAQLFMPPCMVIEMLLQSVGKRLAASILSSMRTGILFIPLLLYLAATRGLAGIQEANPLAIVLCFPISIPFAVYFFRNLKTKKLEPSSP